MVETEIYSMLPWKSQTSQENLFKLIKDKEKIEQNDRHFMPYHACIFNKFYV